MTETASKNSAKRKNFKPEKTVPDYEKGLLLDQLFDPVEIREKLTAYTQQNGGDGSSSAVRAQVLDALREWMQAAREQAYKMLHKGDGRGVMCAQRLSAIQDELISVIYDFAVTHVYRVKNLSEAERIAIVAVGGYGRAMLAPKSDIDLLFLLPYKQTAFGEQLVEYTLYMLWDMGFKVGHATRSIDETLRQASGDITIRTSLVEARLVVGNEPLFDEMEERFHREIAETTAAEFIKAKLDERDKRHAKMGESRYLVEPNVKEGKGALRDLHTLFWIGKYVYHVKRGRQLVKLGVYTDEEHDSFLEAMEFFWTVRCHLHLMANVAEERLSFDVQSDLAKAMGHKDTEAMRAAEHFMKQYFTVARNVGNLTRIFCSSLEESENQASLGRSLIGSLLKSKPKPIGKQGLFVEENGRVNVTSAKVFKDPINAIRLFALADKKGLDYHPNALRALSRHLDFIDENTRNNKELNQLFLEILTKGNQPEITLRHMNEAGLLGRFMPEFGRIEAMMQFNMYHSYTVDEHLIRTVGVLADIESGAIADEHPLARQLAPQVADRELLYVTLLLHDIAKGLPEDHSIAGAATAREICPRLGFSKARTELVAWLIEEHLTMSTIAQSRDLSDRRTIEDFASIVQTRDRLRYLLLLTVCDIRAVGPNTWNGWKGQLLRALYHQTDTFLSGGFGSSQFAADAAHLRQEALTNLTDQWPEEKAKRYIDYHYDAFIRYNSVEEIVSTCKFIEEAEKTEKLVAHQIITNEFQGVTRLNIYCSDYPFLLSTIAKSCAAAGANIVDAKTSTTRTSMALNSVYLSREFQTDADEIRRAKRIVNLVEEALTGERELISLINKRRKSSARLEAFELEPIITVSNEVSDMFTLVEVECKDSLGLLGNLTGKLGELNLNIASARVSTFGEKVIDTFYVTDLLGDRIESPQRRGKIRAALLATIAPDNGNHHDDAKQEQEKA